MIRELYSLLLKEFWMEWKQRYALSGLLLYVFSMVTVIALTFVGGFNPVIWNITFWLIMLFSAIQTVARSFLSEPPGQLIYLYTLARAESVILAKMIYSTLILGIVGSLAFGVYALMAELEIEKPFSYLLLVFLGAAGLSTNLTLMSALASRAENRTMLMAVLSFPVVIPMLLVLIRAGKSLVLSSSTEFMNDAVVVVLGLTVVLGGISVLLFPLVWRE